MEIQDLVDTAEGRYERMHEEREHYLERGRETAELTIPHVLVDYGFTESSDLYTPYQSVGSRGVNNLASKLLLLLFPPNQPFFRLSIDGKAKEQAEQQPEIKTEIEKVLSKIEREVMGTIESEAMRVPVFEALKHLLIAGNVLLHIPKKEKMKVYPLTNYVIKRDASGNPLEIIIKESVSIKALPEEAQQIAYAHMSKEQLSATDDCDLFTHLYRLPDGNFYVCQEIKGVKIPSSIGKFTPDNFPYLPLRMVSVDSESYGRSYVEQYLGDLKSLEGLSQSLVEGAAASSKVVFLVKPNASTKKRDLANTRNGDIITGNDGDVQVLQAQKHYDLGVVEKAIYRFEQRLQFAFLLNAAVQRDAERVTSTEIRYMANELETALGGVYSLLSQELQLPIVRLLMQRMSAKGLIPKLPKGSVKPTIVTGVEALGRGNDLDKLREFVAEISQLAQINPQAVQMLNISDLIQRMANSHGIETEGLIKTQEQLQAEQEAEMQAQQMAQLQQTAQDVAPQVANNLTRQ
tara:strand:- start:6514 stop:8070 length:1557 start_codon:yes stop_codon:yes gene_type:complete